MRLVADESCDFAVVSGMRGAGHDVISITERMPGAEEAGTDFADHCGGSNVVASVLLAHRGVQDEAPIFGKETQLAPPELIESFIGVIEAVTRQAGLPKDVLDPLAREGFRLDGPVPRHHEIGRASCRERV